MIRVKRSSPRIGRLVARRDTRRGAARATAAAGSTMATSSPSSAAPRAQSAQASVDLPASPRPASGSRAFPHDQGAVHDHHRRFHDRRNRPVLHRAHRPGSAGDPQVGSRQRPDPPLCVGPAAVQAVDTPGTARLPRVRGRPGAKDGRRQGPDGGVIRCELEAERSRRPAYRRTRRRRGHETGTIAPCRVNSSRNEETSRSADSPLSAGNRSRRAAVRSSRRAGSGEPLPDPAARGVQNERAAGRPVIEHHTIANGGHLDLLGSHVHAIGRSVHARPAVRERRGALLVDCARPRPSP